MFSVGVIGGADGPTAVFVSGPDNWWLLLIAVVIAYLMGNISPSILMAKAKGIDIRKEGSGNAGTTNALRVMGKKAEMCIRDRLRCGQIRGFVHLRTCPRGCQAWEICHRGL